MRKTSPMTIDDFNQLVEIRTFEQMSDSEINAYTEMFIDIIQERFDEDEMPISFWCPKCERPDATIETEFPHNKAVASCEHCKMTVVVISSLNKEEEEEDGDADAPLL